jgi:hypothetical protein
MRSSTVVVPLLLALSAGPRLRAQAAPLRPGATPACVAQEPDTIRLAGVLVRRTFSGAPNFRSVRHGDARETGFYLRMSPALCARAGDRVHRARTGVKLVQLVLDSTGYSVLRPMVGQHVELRGTLFSSSTGHHHAPLLLRVLEPVQIDR